MPGEASLPLVNNFAPDYGHGTARFENFRFRNFHDVIREDGEIGEFAQFD